MSLLRTFIILIALVSLPAVARADVITFFDFNDENLTSDRGMRPTTITTNFASTGVDYDAGSSVNADPDDSGPLTASSAGRALKLIGNSNNAKSITLSVNTTGYNAIQISFATRRTTTGFNSNQFQYSVDGGATFINFGAPFNPTTSTTFALQTFDLSGITTLNNNPNAVFRILFNGASSATGSTRIDNLLVEGTLLPRDLPPTATPEPATFALLGAGLTGMLSQLSRRRK
jgi:hypothetical protein